MIEDTDIIPRETISAMAEAYQTAQNEIDQAFALLQSADNRMKFLFGKYSDCLPSSHCYEKDDIKKDLKRRAWITIIDRLEIRKVMSTKDLELFDKRMQDTKAMPDITINTILDIVATMHQNAPEYAKKLVFEVYEYLMPGNRSERYATNVKNARRALGKKVIISWAVAHRSWGGGFEVPYGACRDKVLAIDKVFFALDGKGIPTGIYSPLVDAIGTTDNTGHGETDYFKFRAYSNRNLHLEFKRMDLVRQLKEIAGNGNMIAD